MTHSNPWSRHAALIVLALAGCASGARPSAAGTAGAEARASPAYSVHEWGLVRGGAGDTLEAGTIGPGPALAMPLVVLKPVLYFHLEDAARGAVAITTARVTAVEGEIREHFPVSGPYASPFPAAVGWGAIEVEPGACEAPFTAPVLTEPPCSALGAGEVCEAASLGMVVTPDADCVVRAGARSPFLFYRSSTRGLTVPLRVRRLPSGDLEITNDGDLAIPGRVVRLVRSAGVLRVAVVAPPAPHASITAGATWSSAEEGAAALTETLRALGLWEGEAAAFHRAWDPTFFDGGAAAALDLSASSTTLPTLEESIVYFLPPELCERIATIELDPPPTAIRRAMAVWTSI